MQCRSFGGVAGSYMVDESIVMSYNVCCMWCIRTTTGLHVRKYNYSKVVCRAKTDPHTLRNSKYSLISLSGKTDDPYIVDESIVMSLQCLLYVVYSTTGLHIRKYSPQVVPVIIPRLSAVPRPIHIHFEIRNIL
jgi:hypothetical protein